MRPFLATLLLTICVVALCQPVLPWLGYAINKTYFAKVLCINQDKPELKCHGKCHLQMLLQQSNDRQKATSQHSIMVRLALFFSAITPPLELPKYHASTHQPVGSSYASLHTQYTTDIPEHPPNSGYLPY